MLMALLAGVLREVETNSYDSETHQPIQTTRSRYAADGTLESDSISSYDGKGDLPRRVQNSRPRPR